MHANCVLIDFFDPFLSYIARVFAHCSAKATRNGRVPVGAFSVLEVIKMPESPSVIMHIATQCWLPPPIAGNLDTPTSAAARAIVICENLNLVSSVSGGEVQYIFWRRIHAPLQLSRNHSRLCLFVRQRLQHARLFLRPRTAPRYLLRHRLSPSRNVAAESPRILVQSAQQRAWCSA